VRGVQAFDARVRRACSTRVFDARVRRACIIIKIEKTKAETQVLILVFPKKTCFTVEFGRNLFAHSHDTRRPLGM
jgi:hypothetical protein